MNNPSVKDHRQVLSNDELVTLMPAITARYADASPELNRALCEALKSRMNLAQHKKDESD